MTKNKVFILFRMKLLIITLFFLFIPFLFSANATSLDNNRYVIDFSENPQSGSYNFLTISKYNKHTNYLPKCSDGFTGSDWITYPSTTNVPQNVTCLKKNYCSDLDENGELIVQSPGVDENGNPNCYRKSCLDLTTEELKAIFKRQYGVDADAYYESGYTATTGQNFYKFCEPYRYLNMSIGGKSIPVKVDVEPVYCHMFGKDEIKYLIPNVKGIKDTETNSIDVYQCMIHECPLSSIQSATCPTNFWLFSYKNDNIRYRSDDYIAEYEDKMLGGSTTNIGTQLLNYCSDVNCSKYRVTDWLDCNISIDPQCQTCIQKINSYNCGDCFEEIMNESSCNGCYSFLKNTECDDYKGLDNIFKDKTYYTNLLKAFMDYNLATQTCNTDGTCRKSIDCSLIENKDHILCNSETSSDQTMDSDLSYFYRPFPPQESTEILPVKRSWIADGTIAEHIYSDDYDPDVIRASSSIEPIAEVTVIKRSLRGSMIKPIPSTKTFTRDTKSLTSTFSNINENSNRSDFFNYIDKKNYYNDYTNNICIPNNEEFMKYVSRKTYLTSNSQNKWDEGEYYYKSFVDDINNGKFITSEKIINTPLCDLNNERTNRLVKSGRRAFCTQNYDDNDVCDTPRSDSYYIKGKPNFTWQAGTNKIATASVTVCLRRRSEYKGEDKHLEYIVNNYGGTTLVPVSTSYGVCGARECFISCANADCTEFTQTCGDDMCVTLTWHDGDDCTIKNLDKYDIYNHPSCARAILYTGTTSKGKPDAIRFRLNRHPNNGNFYVYVDAGNDNCKWAGADENDYRKSYDKFYTRSVNDKTVFGTTTIKEYIGKIDDRSLIDDNSLTNYDGNATYITDADVYGEELYKQLNCDNINSELSPCNSMASNIGEGTGNWVGWDIVQYIGNNQPTENNPNCKVGQLMNCRGYYDAEGVFHREQQGFSAPLAISPDVFYRYATKENSSDMFTPLLKIKFVITHDDNVYVLKNTEEDKEVELSFFEPNMTINYELRELSNVKLSFQESEQEYLIHDSKGKNPQYFIIKKTHATDDISQPQVCISKVFESKDDKGFDGYDYEDVVQCLKRKKPTAQSLAIRPIYPYEGEKPHLIAFFINYNNVNKNEDVINENNKDNVLAFLNREQLLNGIEKRELFDNSSGILQGYVINIKKSYCAQLHHECLDIAINLEEQERAYTRLVNENALLTSVNTAKSDVSKLKSKLDTCNNIIKPYCENITDGVIMVKELYSGNNLTISNDYNAYFNNYNANIRECVLANNCSDTLQNLINKIHQYRKNKELTFQHKVYPKNYRLNPATNDICVVSGFEDYYPNVIALPSADLQRPGKCILNNSSKLKSECRREYYVEYCTDNADSQCFCIDGTAECDCTFGDTCIKKNYCTCSDTGEGIACDELPEECYLPGYNGYGIVLNSSDKLDKICECEYNTDGIAQTGREIRKATARELGFCGDLRNINFCEPVKYYNSEKIYVDGGAGEKLDVIQNKYYSNIWRTNQKQYGKLSNDNLEHAEFDLSTYSNAYDYFRLEKLYCVDENNNGYYYALPIDACYNEYTKCLSQEECEVNPEKCFTPDECKNRYEKCLQNSTCQDGYRKIYATEGECKGFWKNKTVRDSLNKKYDLNPLAVCQQTGLFKLIANSGCERYSCPAKSELQPDYGTYDEKSSTIINEKTQITANLVGKSNGFANWNSYKKGTYNIITGEILTDDNENGHGDDIEQQRATSCITGYAPAGFKNILQQYYPVPLIDGNSSDGQQDLVIDSNFNMDIFIDNMLLNTEDIVSTENMLSTLSYDAREHLPVRYCNQIGEWMPVLDIYNRFNVPLYYIGSPVYSNNYVDLDKYSTTTKSKIETNTYGITVDYSQKYCERLFCKALNGDDINSINKENADIDINNVEKYKIISNKTNTNIAYFKDNSEVNKFTVWRHTGGATWPETPTSLKGDSVDVVGTCYNEDSYYPNNAEFILDSYNYQGNNIKFSSFEKQYDSIFEQNNIGTTVNPRDFNLISNSSNLIQPTRECNKYGMWGEISDKCQVACEPIDPFRTKYNDLNNDGKIQNTEILELYKIPHVIGQYYIQNGNLKYGDKYTGGARWGRTLAGQYAIGECDSTVSYGTQIYKNNALITSTENIIFINSGSSENISPFPYDIGGRPYRECLPDGTWGPVHNPCVLYNETCGNKKIFNRDLINNPNSIERTELVATLNSSSLVMDDITNNGNQVAEITLETSCDPRYYTGKISQQCNINTQNWSGPLNSNCNLKTCNAYNETVNNIEFISIPGETYYMKDTGFTGLITLNNRTYQGYQVNQACPNYYKCVDCKDNKLQYTCEYDTDINQQKWNSTGECQPISCSFGDLVNYCNDGRTCIVDETTSENNLIPMPDNSPLQAIKNEIENVVFLSTSTKYDREKNLFAVGSHIKLLPPPGFVDSPSTPSYAYCNTDGYWYTISNFQTIKCEDFSSTDEENKKVWDDLTEGKCADGTKGYNCPGAVKRAKCLTSQSEGSQIAICTENKDGTASWVYEGNLMCYEGCFLNNVSVSINNVSCLCPTNIPELGYECSTSQPVCVDLMNLNYSYSDVLEHNEITAKTISNVNGIAGITAKIVLECNNGKVTQKSLDASAVRCNCYNGCTGLISELPCNN